MIRPFIGLTGSRFFGRDIARNLDVLGDSPVDVFYADYAQAVLAAGGIPLFLPLDLDPAVAAARIDGLLLTGGDDIEPARYGHEHADLTHAAEPTRDEYELELLTGANDREVPILGICRGLQMINVHAGGTLHQHVPEHAFVDEPGSKEQHEVALQAGSVLADLYGSSKQVNSLHHQSVDALGDGLVVTASTADGGVEGVEHADLPIVAVQWHPEMMTSASTDPIFSWLVNHAQTRAA